MLFDFLWEKTVFPSKIENVDWRGGGGGCVSKRELRKISSMHWSCLFLGVEKSNLKGLCIISFHYFCKIYKCSSELFFLNVNAVMI